MTQTVTASTCTPLPAGPGLSDANHWDQPQYYSTIQCADLDGDCQEELLARASGGVCVWKCTSKGDTYQWAQWAPGPSLSDTPSPIDLNPTPWNQPQYYSTIQCADLDGDGQAELLARASSGIYAWKYDEASHQWTRWPDGPGLSDANHWDQPQYYSTIQCADLDGDGQAELLARAAEGIRVWKCDKTSHQWADPIVGPELSDANHWDQPQYYSTIQCADLDGDGQAELLARASGGICVWKYERKGDTYQWTQWAPGPALKDTASMTNPDDVTNWKEPEYYSTIQCADLDGDGHAELLARAADGMYAWKCDEITHQWTKLPGVLVALCDSNGWFLPQYYNMIRCADLDGDGQAELFTRGPNGIRVWKCDKTSYQWTELPAGPALKDTTSPNDPAYPTHWDQPQYYSTIQCADLDGDGQAELLARGNAGIIAWQCDQNTAWVGQRVTGVPTLNMQQYLSVGDYLVSPQSQCVAVVQDDGNFVVYRISAPDEASEILWETGTAGLSPGEYFVTMTNDGNLVLYQGPHPTQSEKALWSTGLTGLPAAQMTTTLFDTGELVISLANQTTSPFWSSQPMNTNWTSSDWMSILQGNKFLSQLTLPGTHDSCALRFVPWAQCQTLSLTDQLTKGIRFLDIRCRHIDDAFAIHHASVYQDMMFGDVQNACIAFLQAHPTECIVMSVKEEYEADNNELTFQATFDAYIQDKQNYWYLGDQIPSLNAVRGKIVLIRRFNVDQPQTVRGIDASGSKWEDNKTFPITNNTTGGTVVLQVQDEYQVPTVSQIANKAEKTLNFVKQAVGGNNTDWYLNFASGSGSSTTPQEVAFGAAWTDDITGLMGVSGIGVNEQLLGMINQYLKAGSQQVRLGTIIMDFPDDDLIHKIISINGLSPDKRLTIVNEGLYVASCSFEYDFNGQHYSKSSGNLSTQQSYSITIPAAAIKVHLKCQMSAQGTGTWNTLFDSTYATAASKTFVLVGSPDHADYYQR